MSDLILDEFSLYELGQVSFTRRFGYRTDEATVWECLDCGSLVVNKQSHLRWHKQMEESNDE